MALKFTSTKDAGQSANILVYGESGSGKTTMIATAPNPVVISSEKGLLSIAKYDIPVIEISTLDDFKDAYDYVDNHKKKFATVCLDSISDIAESVLADLLKNVRDPRQAYGSLNSEVSEMVRKFRDINLNTYVIAKAETYESAAGIPCMRPSLPGRKLTNDIDYMFDIVCALLVVTDEDDTHRFLQTSATNTIVAKDRSGKLNKIEKPNLKKLFKKIRSKK